MKIKIKLFFILKNVGHMYLFVVHKIMNKYFKIKIHPILMDFLYVENHAKALVVQ